MVFNFLIVIFTNLLDRFSEAIQLSQPDSFLAASGLFLFFSYKIFKTPFELKIVSLPVLCYRILATVYDSYYCNARLETSRHNELSYPGSYLATVLVTSSVVASLLSKKVALAWTILHLVTFYLFVNKVSSCTDVILNLQLFFKILFLESYFALTIFFPALTDTLMVGLWYDELILFVVLSYRILVRKEVRKIKVPVLVAGLTVKLAQYSADLTQLADTQLLLFDLLFSSLLRLWCCLFYDEKS